MKDLLIGAGFILLLIAAFLSVIFACFICLGRLFYCACVDTCSTFTHKVLEIDYFCPFCGIQLRDLPIYCPDCLKRVYEDYCSSCGAYCG